MTSIALEGITVLADDVAQLAEFYERGVGLAVAVREPHYVAFSGSGIRLAIFERGLMGANTHDHPSFAAPRGAQAFELNFECETVDEVERMFRHLVEHGATSIAEPADMDWGHFTGFFADPEGNIHSLFAVL